MKKLYKRLSIVAIVLFIIGIFAAAYALYKFPEKLIDAQILDMLDMNQVRPILGMLNLTIGLVLLFGLAAVILLLLADKSTTKENVIYVETFKAEAGKTNTEGEVNETKTMSEEEKLDAIKQILEKQKDVKTAFDQVLSLVCKSLEASQGAIYLTKESAGKKYIELFSSFAFIIPESQSLTYELGEGLAGQAAKVGELVNIKSVPNGYIKIFSGLGSTTPSHLVLVPLKSDKKVVGVAEIASFKAFSGQDEKFLEAVFALLVPKAKSAKESGKEPVSPEKSSS
jgi:putative methionine-R-sulfoxide reductase with GAF domain/uncharacterized membrane protein YvlD (DUF360 family)